MNAVSRHRRVPPFASSRRSPSHALTWPFAVARATQVCRRNHNQSGTGWEAIALARSDHPAAMGESEPSVTLPRTSPPAIVWYQQEPVLKRYPAIDATGTSGSRAWVHVGQPALKTALKASHKVHYRPDRSAWGRTVPDHDSAVWSRFVMVCATSCFCGFGQPFPRWGGPPEKKYRLESCSEIDETGLCPVSVETAPTGSQAKKTTGGAFAGSSGVSLSTSSECSHGTAAVIPV